MTLHIYTDGACSNNGYANARAGVGVFFQGLKDMPLIVSKAVNPKFKQTNNVAELLAVYYALKRVYFYYKEPIQLHFYIDNKIALNTLLTTRKSGENWNIIEKIYHIRKILLDKGFKISGEWVKAHSTSKGNKIADQLACAGKEIIHNVGSQGAVGLTDEQ